MKKATVSFRHFSGSGPLSVYWHAGPYGDAIEAIAGAGVAWLAPNGDLLGIEFDDVRWEADDQTLELPNGDTVSVRVRRGQVDGPREAPQAGSGGVIGRADRSSWPCP